MVVFLEKVTEFFGQHIEGAWQGEGGRKASYASWVVPAFNIRSSGVVR